MKKIKKLLALGLVVIMMTSMSACGNNDDLQKRIEELENKITEQEDKITEQNKNIDDLNNFLDEAKNIAGKEEKPFTETVDSEVVNCKDFTYNYPVLNTDVVRYIKFAYNKEGEAFFELNFDQSKIRGIHGINETNGWYNTNAIMLNPISDLRFMYYDGREFINDHNAFNEYVDILLWENGNIIGYGAIDIYKGYRTSSCGSSPYLKANLVHFALIPKVEGKYQKVTEKQARNAIEKVKVKYESAE